MSVIMQHKLVVLLIVLLGFTSFTTWADDDDDNDDHDDYGDYHYNYRHPTIFETLLKTDGAQALVATVLLIDESGALGKLSLARLLDNRRAELIFFAPSNAAIEKYLKLEPGTFNGMMLNDVIAELRAIAEQPSSLPPNLMIDDFIEILLHHLAAPRKANLRTASESRLLARGKVMVADGSKFPVSIGASGVQVNYESTIIKADIKARNGVLHFMDSVIVDDVSGATPTFTD